MKNCPTCGQSIPEEKMLFDDIERGNLPEWIPQDSWDGYVEMRKKIKKPLTDFGKKLALRKLKELRIQGNHPQTVLENSIFNCYQGLFGKETNGHSEPEDALAREERRDRERKSNVGRRQS